MAKVIVLTEEQLRKIEEMTFDKGIVSPSTIPNYPQSQVTVSGKKNKEEFADPVTTDQYADNLSKSFPWGCGAYYRGYLSPIVAEGEESGISDMYNDTDETGDGVPDKFNHADANQLSNSDETDNMEVIPHSIEKHLNKLIQAVKQANLPEKKQVNILNKLIDSMDIENIPPSYKKESMLKISAKK